MTTGIPAVFPTSFAQERFWLSERIAPGTAAYHVPVALRLRGPLDRDALGAALDAVVERHETLRTVFEQIDGRTVQRVLPAEPVDVEVRDAAGDDLGELLTSQAALGFALDRGPLLRAVLFRIGDRDHVLALTLHHLVSDMWSIQILLRELSVAYCAHVDGVRPELSELPIQYADYAVWERENLTADRRDELLAHWRAALDGAPQALDLPTDRPRPAVQRHVGAEERVALSAATSAQVRELARGAGVTPFMVLLAGFGALLGRFAGTDDVVVGTAAGARDPQTEPLIGCFVNTVPLRLRLDGDPSFAELLTRARRVTLDSLDHQDLPFDRLVEGLAPRRDLSRNPVTQVLLTVQNAPERAVRLTGLEAEPVPVVRGGAQCDLSLHLEEADGRFEGFVEYAADLFDAATVRRWWGHLETLLAAASADPGARVSALPCLTDEQVARIAGDWNATASTGNPPMPGDLTADPAATALSWPGGTMTYAGLDRRAGEIAAAVRDRGAAPGGLVALYGDRDPDMVAAVFGVLRTGAAYLPLNTDHPRDRLAVMLDDARPVAVLTRRDRASDLPEGTPVLCLEDIAAAPGTVPAADGALAYVCYTSGSTGRPKGVAVGRRAVADRLAWLQRRYPIGPDDAVLLKTPLSFDVSVPELFWPAAAGARAVVLPQGHEKDPAAVLDAIADQRVTVADFVPSLLGGFLDAAEADPGKTASLRYVLCAGEALPARHVRRFHEIFGGRVRLANLYGPTETTVYVTAHDCAGAEEPVPIGTPSDGTAVYVMDAQDRPQPPGVPGELCVSGAGLADGYLGRPAATAERFVPNPFAGVLPGIPPGARMYRTGDLCRYDDEGVIEWLARLDLQVKVRGFRIELEEVAAALHAHPAVAEAVVAVRPDDPERLVGYYVPAPGADPTVSDLRAELRRTLPDHMVPAVFVALDAMPLSPNGKTDRAALPAPDLSRPALGSAYVAPRTPLEQVIAAIWLDVLDLDRVGVDDDFFDLGGQSLLATRVTAGLRETLGVEVPLRGMFAAPTIAAQADGLGPDAAAVAELVLHVQSLSDDQVSEALA